MIGADGEIIAPGKFLPVAEQYGLMGEIDRHVFELAMAYAAAGHRIGINLSADSISEPGLFAFVRDTPGVSGDCRMTPARACARYEGSAMLDSVDY